nr:hypothetical protein [Agrobacterium sp. SORGH_AS_0440]
MPYSRRGWPFPLAANPCASRSWLQRRNHPLRRHHHRYYRAEKFGRAAAAGRDERQSDRASEPAGLP